MGYTSSQGDSDLKITIVTVCYNAEKTIERTIESVISQNYPNIEYLIIDGKSTDATMDIVRKYETIPYIRIVSEKDNGLYHAMNKGANMATGDYILFLNSGDYLCDDNVIKEISTELSADIIYGNVIRQKQDGDVLEKYPGKYKVMWLLLQGRMVSHQVIFTKTAIMRQLGFDESYKITADYNFLLRAKKEHCSMHYVDRNVSVVENVEGISSQRENLDLMRKEDDRSLKECFPFWYYVLKPVKYLARRYGIR